MSAEALAGPGETALEPRLEAIYREHHGFVWSTLLRLGVPGASVDDACQDAFVIVFRRLNDFEGRSHVRTWLFSIARRVAFRHRRGAQRATRKVQAFAAETRPVESLDEMLEQRRAAMLVLHALDELDDDKRTAVVLHIFEGMSGPKIAEMLGLPLDTAYSRIKAGRRVLRARLEALGVGGDARVLEAARRDTEPSDEAGRRVAVLLAARLSATPVLVGTAWKAVAAAVAVGFAGFVGASVMAESATDTAGTPAVIVLARPEPTTVSTPAVPSAVPFTEAVSAAEAVVSSPAESKAPVRSLVRSRELGSGEDGLEQEVALIGAVKNALDRGRPADAMRRLDEHARRFSNGELSLERRGYRAIALCEVGKQTQGRGAGRVFVKAHPRATLAGRVRAACQLEEKTTGR